jgi:hypothetical protein
MELIEKSGAALYVKIEMEKHRSEGLEALRKAQPAGQSGEFLTQLLATLGQSPDA